jgi:hypothetical protein
MTGQMPMAKATAMLAARARLKRQATAATILPCEDVQPGSGKNKAKAFSEAN